MPISLMSPNVDNYPINRGIMYMKFPGEGDYADMGDCTDVDLTPDLTLLKHFTNRTGTKSEDKSVVLEKACVLKAILSEATARNMGLALLGTPVVTSGHVRIPIFKENIRVAAVKFVGTNDVGPKWTYEFPRVEFSPKSPIKLISAEWGTLELEGAVIADPTSGEFGAVDGDFTEAAPVNQVLPAIIGTAQVGQTLMVFPGVWLGLPSFTYQWQKAGVNIAGAVANSYIPVVGDIGATLTCEVTGTNTFSSVMAESPATAAVIAA